MRAVSVSGSVRNELKVDAGCCKVHASAWKALGIKESANFCEKLAMTAIRRPPTKQNALSTENQLSINFQNIQPMK